MFTYIVYSILDLLIILFVLFLDTKGSVITEMNTALTMICCVTILLFVRIFAPFMVKGYAQVVNTVLTLQKAEDNEILISKISSSRSGIFDNTSIEDV
jgi:C4-dicarboxylate transporter